MTRQFLYLCLSAWLFTNVANATPIYVDPTSDGSSVDFWINESHCAPFAPCNIDGQLSGDIDAASAWLEVGESFTFDFFIITVGGLGAVSDLTVRAVLAFRAPDILPTSNGTGSFFTFFGLVSGGTLVWDQPDAIDLGDGSWIQISFEDIDAIGLGNSTTVSATAARSVAVPEPGTLALLGLGLIGLWFSRRHAATG